MESLPILLIPFGIFVLAYVVASIINDCPREDDPYEAKLKKLELEERKLRIEKLKKEVK